MQRPDIHITPDAPPSLCRCHGERDKGACLNEQPAVGVVIGPLLVIALVALQLDDFANMLEGQVERRLVKLLDELARVRFVARGGQLVMNRQSHVVSLAFMVQRPRPVRHPRNTASSAAADAPVGAPGGTGWPWPRRRSPRRTYWLRSL